jgi:purine-binding chemotaxis protein CheW
MENIEQIVIFNSGENEFAFDIMKVQEIIRYKKITKVPQSEKFLLGVVNLRGNVLPVIDYQFMTNNEPSDLEKNKRIIIVEVEGHKIGVLVDSVREVLRVDPSLFEDLPQSSIATNISNTMIKLDKGERIISMINVDMFHKVINNFDDSSTSTPDTSSELEAVS